MFNLPQPGEHNGASETLEGTDDGHPVKLDGVKKAEWEYFLQALYPR
jgi:hypothetical protein